MLGDMQLAVQAQDGLICNTLQHFNSLLLDCMYTCMLSNSQRMVVLCAECTLAGGSWKDNELNMVPFQGFCLWYTLPPL